MPGGCDEVFLEEGLAAHGPGKGGELIAVSAKRIGEPWIGGSP